MKTRIQYNFLLLLLILISFSCKKDSHQGPSLPPASKNGSDIMGAYINNVVWHPLISIYGTGIISEYGGTAFTIIGYSDNSNHTIKTSINVDLRNFNGVGSYTLNATLSPVGSANSGQVLIEQKGSNIEYDTDSLHWGSVVVTHFDPGKQIVSGTFQFDAVNKNNPLDIVKVTSGRFDVACPITLYGYYNRKNVNKISLRSNPEAICLIRKFTQIHRNHS